MSAERPKCVNCGKPLGKHIWSTMVPFDRTDVLEYVRSLHPTETTVALMDKVSKINDQQIAKCKAFEKARERYAFETSGWRDNEHRQPRFYFPQMSEPLLSQYAVWVRTWFGKYGYDGQGVFHSGECAKIWGTTLAVSLRMQGKI